MDDLLYNGIHQRQRDAFFTVPEYDLFDGSQSKAAVQPGLRYFRYDQSENLGWSGREQCQHGDGDNATVTITINVTVYESSYTNTLALKNGSTTILTISGLSWSSGTANRTVTLTADQRTTLLTAMASIKSFTGTFAVSSFHGQLQIGSTSSKTATVQTTATNSAPTISDFTYADSYTTTKNLTGNDQLFVQDYSTLKVTPGTATAKNGASMRRSMR